MMSENRQIGTGLLALGGIFLFLGMLLFFDPGLLAIGETSITRQAVYVLLLCEATEAMLYEPISMHAAAVYTRSTHLILYLTEQHYYTCGVLVRVGV